MSNRGYTLYQAIAGPTGFAEGSRVREALRGASLAEMQEALSIAKIHDNTRIANILRREMSTPVIRSGDDE
jgi:hypothetical protein